MASPRNDPQVRSCNLELDEEVDCGSDTSFNKEEWEVPDTPILETELRLAPNPFVERCAVNASSTNIINPLDEQQQLIPWQDETAMRR